MQGMQRKLRIVGYERFDLAISLEIELDRGYRRCAADQCVAFGGRVQRLRRTTQFAFDQATFAVVAYARTAGPAQGNGARFGQLEQAAEAGVPWHGEPASQERHH